MREPSPVKLESKLSEMFNKEIAHNIPGVLTNIIEELIKEVEMTRVHSLSNAKKIDN